MTQSSAAKPKHRKAFVIAALALAVIIIVGVSVSFLPSILKTESNSKEDVVAPKVEITSTTLRSAPIEEHLAYVDLSLNNTGGDGTVIVRATISDEVNSYYANKTINIKSQETMNLTLTFSEVTFSDFSQVHAYPWIQLPEVTDKNQIMP